MGIWEVYNYWALRPLRLTTLTSIRVVQIKFAGLLGNPELYTAGGLESKVYSLRERPTVVSPHPKHLFEGSE